MVFRADEAATSGFAEVRNYFISKQFSVSEREAAEQALLKIVSECGPPVASYPTWHPLVPQKDGRSPEAYPSERSGYRNLDHTRFFVNGFVTCPYGDGERVLDSILSDFDYHHPIASITAERVEAPLYSHGATAILVRCDWSIKLELNHTIPKSVAVPLMLEQELPAWRWAELAETWETMRPYLLGQPHGNRSSLFVTQDTALAMKKIYLAMVDSGMYGATKLHRRR